MDTPRNSPDEARKETMLFAQLIEILAQNAVMMLGGMPDRHGRQRPPDLNSAEMMIEMLSVLQKRTKGNLSKDEEKMLSGALYQLQTAFAEIASKSGDFSKARKATEAAEAADEEEHEDPAPPPNRQAPPPTPSQPAQGGKPLSSEQTSERKVKFTKKYD